MTRILNKTTLGAVSELTREIREVDDLPRFPDHPPPVRLMSQTTVA